MWAIKIQHVFEDKLGKKGLMQSCLTRYAQLKSSQIVPSQRACGARRGLWPHTHPSPEQPGASWDLPFLSCRWGRKFSLLCRIAKGIYLGWLNLALESRGWAQERILGRQAGEPGGHGEFITLVFPRGCARSCGPEPDTEIPLLSFSPVSLPYQVLNPLAFLVNLSGRQHFKFPPFFFFSMIKPA